MNQKEGLFKSKLPNPKDNPNGPQNYPEYARKRAHWPWSITCFRKRRRSHPPAMKVRSNSSPRSGCCRGMFSLLEWVRFGIAATLRMPKGPFPGGAGQPSRPVSGRRRSTLGVYALLRRAAQRSPANHRRQRTGRVHRHGDRPAFPPGRTAEVAQCAAARKTEEGDSKATQAEELTPEPAPIAGRSCTSWPRRSSRSLRGSFRRWPSCLATPSWTRRR